MPTELFLLLGPSMLLVLRMWSSACFAPSRSGPGCNIVKALHIVWLWCVCAASSVRHLRPDLAPRTGGWSRLDHPASGTGGNLISVERLILAGFANVCQQRKPGQAPLPFLLTWTLRGSLPSCQYHGQLCCYRQSRGVAREIADGRWFTGHSVCCAAEARGDSLLGAAAA